MNESSPNWSSDRLKDVSKINSNSLAANTDPSYEFDYLEISNVNYYGVVDQSAIEHLRFEDAPSRARRRVGENSTVISSVRPNLQAIAFFPNVKNHFVCSTGFNVVQPYESRLNPKFAFYVLVSECGRQYLESTAKGVGYPAVDDKDFGSFPVPLPPQPEQINGDLLYNRTNSPDQVGKAAIFRGKKTDKITFASYLVRLRTNHRANPHFLNHVLNCRGFLSYARKLAIPSVQQSNLSSTRYGRMLIPLPPIAEQVAIHQFLDSKMGEMQKVFSLITCQIETLLAYRKSLIHECVTGQMRVSEDDVKRVTERV